MPDLLECFDEAVAVGAVASSGSSTTLDPAPDPADAMFGDDATLDEEVDEVDDAVESFRRSL